jgi:speckle-type POZ protein
MNHQNQTPNKWHMRPCSLQIDDDFMRLEGVKTVPKAFHRRLDRSLPIYIGVGKARAVHDFETCLFTVECTVTMFREPAAAEGAIPVPSSDLTEHLGELLHSQAVVDVTFSVSGECFAAHKSVLAARSPVFMAESFGEKKMENFQLVEIQGIGSDVFKAMLQFIYTDAVLELDVKPDVAMTAFSQDLLIAADTGTGWIGSKLCASSGSPMQWMPAR